MDTFAPKYLDYVREHYVVEQKVKQTTFPGRWVFISETDYTLPLITHLINPTDFPVTNPIITATVAAGAEAAGAAAAGAEAAGAAAAGAETAGAAAGAAASAIPTGAGAPMVDNNFSPAAGAAAGAASAATGGAGTVSTVDPNWTRIELTRSRLKTQNIPKGWFFYAYNGAKEFDKLSILEYDAYYIFSVNFIPGSWCEIYNVERKHIPKLIDAKTIEAMRFVCFNLDYLLGIKNVWLGVKDPYPAGLVKYYTDIGFIPITRDAVVPYYHYTTPLGAQFDFSFISFVLKDKFDIHTNCVYFPLKLQHPIEIGINFSIATVSDILEKNVMKAPTESSIVFSAATRRGKGEKGQLNLMWRKNGTFSVDLDDSERETTSWSEDNVALLSPLFTKEGLYLISSHTHPKNLYYYCSVRDKSAGCLDISPPSEGDLHLCLQFSTGTTLVKHIVWAIEGAYSIRVNPNVLRLRPDEKELLKAGQIKYIYEYIYSTVPYFHVDTMTRKQRIDQVLEIINTNLSDYFEIRFHPYREHKYGNERKYSLETIYFQTYKPCVELLRMSEPLLAGSNLSTLSTLSPEVIAAMAALKASYPLGLLGGARKKSRRRRSRHSRRNLKRTRKYRR